MPIRRNLLCDQPGQLAGLAVIQLGCAEPKKGLRGRLDTRDVWRQAHLIQEPLEQLIGRVSLTELVRDGPFQATVGFVRPEHTRQQMIAHQFTRDARDRRQILPDDLVQQLPGIAQSGGGRIRGFQRILQPTHCGDQWDGHFFQFQPGGVRIPYVGDGGQQLPAVSCVKLAALKLCRMIL